jgi:hypothetical protein
MDGDAGNKTSVNSSPERHTFQAECYIKDCEEKGEEPSEDYLNFFKTFKERDQENMVNPEWQKDNLEYDLRSTKWICDKAKANKWYAQNIYAAMCNMQFQRIDVWPILTNQRWSASWRSAGGIVADMVEQGDYIDWYCSGMGGLNAEYDGEETSQEYQARTKYVPEGTVTDEVREDLRRLGWIAVKWADDDE